MDHRLAGEEAVGDDLVAPLVVGKLGLGDGLAPDPPLQALHQLGRRALADDAAAGDDRHGGAEVGNVLDDMGGEDHHHVLADLGQEVQEAVSLLRVEACGGLIDDDQPRVAEQGLGDAEALAHAAGEAGERLVADLPEVHLGEEALDHRLAIGGVGEPLQHGQMV